jgi:hypothetical protein
MHSGIYKQLQHLQTVKHTYSRYLWASSSLCLQGYSISHQPPKIPQSNPLMVTLTLNISP